MFTGIISAIGTLRAIQDHGLDRRLFIQTDTFDLRDVQLGDSIAVSGICLTVLTKTVDIFSADVSRETLSCTTLGEWVVGRRVNLEKALRLNDRFGGHWVSGHVDGIGKLIQRSVEGRSQCLRFIAPGALMRYIAAKGSISVDGVSLTVNISTPDGFTVNVIPHTLAQTTLDQLQPQQAVNLEVDLIARYLEQLLRAGTAEPTLFAPATTLELLKQRGFIQD